MITMASVVQQGLIFRERIFTFSVQLPDKPGELVRVADTIAKAQGNVIKLEHNQFKAIDRVQNVQLEVTAETNGHEHIKTVIDALEAGGFKVNRIY